MKQKKCSHKSCNIEILNIIGQKPKKYCSTSCRQKAYHLRRTMAFKNLKKEVDSLKLVNSTIMPKISLPLVKVTNLNVNAINTMPVRIEGEYLIDFKIRYHNWQNLNNI